MNCMWCDSTEAKERILYIGNYQMVRKPLKSKRHHVFLVPRVGWTINQTIQ